MQYYRNEKGVSNFKVFVVLLLLFMVIHVGVKLIPMYIDAGRMQDEMTTKASVAQVLKDEEIMTALVNKAKDLELPLTADNFILQRDEDRHRMRISTKWDVEVNFFWGAYIRKFHFEPVADEDYTITKR